MGGAVTIILDISNLAKCYASTPDKIPLVLSSAGICSQGRLLSRQKRQQQGKQANELDCSRLHLE